MNRTISDQRTVVFTITDCITCSVEFGVPGRFMESRRKDKQTFYCPNGHSMVFNESESDRLRKQLTEAQDTLSRREASLEAERRQNIALRGQATKLRKRIANGVCPCCQRTFTNVARHMATKHPEYAEPPSP